MLRHIYLYSSCYTVTALDGDVFKYIYSMLLPVCTNLLTVEEKCGLYHHCLRACKSVKRHQLQGLNQSDFVPVPNRQRLELVTSLFPKRKIRTFPFRSSGLYFSTCLGLSSGRLIC